MPSYPDPGDNLDDSDARLDEWTLASLERLARALRDDDDPDGYDTGITVAYFPYTGYIPYPADDPHACILN